MKLQVTQDHYFDPKYDSKSRFISYWHQINEILSLKPTNVLEIGVGSSFVYKYIDEKGVKIRSLDIDKELNPDLVCSVLRLAIRENTFDAVSCCEVLEHLPYSDFSLALREIRRVSKRYVLLSIPDVTDVLRVDIELPLFNKREIKKLLPNPLRKPLTHVFDGQHYWEIGKAGYPLKSIERDIRQSGFGIRKTYRVFEFYYHRFFLLEKR